jgi:ATP:ADP antiporter, AAA family
LARITTDKVRKARPLGRGVNRWPASRGEIRANERSSALAAGLLLFILLTALMVLQPVREALGLMRGIENVRRLFLVTVAATLLLAPLFGWLVARVPRRTLLALSFRLCAVILLGFFVGLTQPPEHIRSLVAAGYYVFHSVFNLLVISLFWAFMADHFSFSESKRLFPAIALGGSLGAILGSLIAWQLVHRLGVYSLFLLAALLLELSVWAAGSFARTRTASQACRWNEHPVGGPSLAGVTAIVRSPYLRAVGLFVVLLGFVSTFLYFSGLRVVAATSDSPVRQTALFACINLWMQLATLAAQAFLAARIMQVAGVGCALSVLPVLAVSGFAVLALVPTLAAFTAVNALFRAAQQGIAGPAQETLFTVLDRQDKYKAKSFLDTFGVRAGDASGAFLDRVLAVLAPSPLPLGLAMLGLAAIWLALCGFLARTQIRIESNSNGPSQAAQALR